MRKNFLLLFLMALLPLAGWATDYDVQVTTYNGSAVWCGGKPAVQPSWFTASFVGGGSPTAAQKEIIAGGLQVKAIASNPDYNVGAWDYQLELRGDQTISGGGDNFTIYVNSSTTATLTITKFTGGPVFTTTSLAFVGGDLVYTGEPQALLAGGATATANGANVPVVYTTKATPAETDWVALENLKETNANTTGYTVKYKVVGTDNYAGSEVQTLGGTKAIAKADNTISALAFAGWTYDPAKTAEPLATGDNPVITITATNDAANATFSYKKGTGEYGTWADKVGGHAGSYTLKATIAESDNYKAGEATVDFTIAKATAVLNVEGVINTDWTVYDGNTHQLFKQAATATVGESQTPVTVKYTYKYCPPGGSYDASWATARTSITNSNLKKTDAGRYRLNISVEGTDDYNGASNKVNDAFPVLEVAQADIPTDSYTAPAAKTLMDTGAEQELISAGTWASTSYGNFEYSLNNTDWATTVPVGSAAQDYTVYARITPTGTTSVTRTDASVIEVVNYKSTVFDPIAVTIAEKTTVTIAAKANQTFGYGTTPVIDYTTVWTEQGSDELVVTGMVWNWYTDSDCSTPATVDGNDNFTVGDYFVKASGATVTGTTATSQEIVYTPVAVKITAGQVTASISATAVYGSLPTYTLTHVSGLSPAEAENFNAANNLGVVTVKKGEEIILNGVANNSNDLKTLPQGTYTLEAIASCGANYAVVVSAGTLTVSAKSIAGAVINVTTDADAIVYNNKAWGTVNPIAFTVDETSGIEAADYDVAYSNNVNAGTATITLTGKRNYTGTISTTFTIKKAALTIKANNTTWKYGTTEPTYAVTVEGQAEGETALEVGGTLAGIDGALTVVRTSNETVGTHAGALVAKFGSAQPAASDNYTITYSAGNLQIAQAALTIKLKNNVITGTYGNDPSVAITAAILTDKDNYELDNCELPDGNLADILNVDGVDFAMVNPIANNKYEVNDAGYEFTMTGATTTNYAVTISNGTYKVNPSPIKLYAKNQAINWATDPTATPKTTVDNETVGIDTDNSGRGLQCGDELTDLVKSIDIESTNVGVNDINLTLKTNANYTVTWTPGTLTVAGAATLAMTSDYDEDDNWFSTITSYHGKPVEVTIEINRTQTLLSGKTYTWKGEEWNAFILPFDITPKELSEKFGYAIVNVVNPTKTTADNIAFKLNMSEEIPANTPFMLKNYQAVAPGTVINFGAKTIVAPASKEVSVDAGGGWTFIGSYDKKTIDNSNSDIYYYNGEGAWKHLGATSTNTWNIAPFNAYMLQPASSAPTQEVTFTFEDLGGGTTAIKSISEDATGTNAKGWYDLKGMKMENAPTQKGVYIKDGKKVVIK